MNWLKLINSTIVNIFKSIFVFTVEDWENHKKTKKTLSIDEVFDNTQKSLAVLIYVFMFYVFCDWLKALLVCDWFILTMSSLTMWVIFRWHIALKELLFASIIKAIEKYKTTYSSKTVNITNDGENQ